MAVVTLCPRTPWPIGTSQTQRLATVSDQPGGRQQPDCVSSVTASEGQRIIPLGHTVRGTLSFPSQVP